MNNNEICNTKVEVASGINLNEKDYTNTLLSCLKELAKNYTTAMTEASNESLYDVYKHIFDNIISLQREVYQLMFRKGWYVLVKSEVNKINNKFNTLNTEYNDLDK